MESLESLKLIFQNATDEAIKENKLVSFVCEESNEQIRKILSSIDLKQCIFWKATSVGTKVTVAPKHIHNDIFG